MATPSATHHQYYYIYCKNQEIKTMENLEIKYTSEQKSNLEIVKYTNNQKSNWDNFINNSKNGIFLFNRDYMEYHSGRFRDNSLMFFNGNKLLAVMPANISDNVLYSHAGLTFGGIITNNNMKTSKMLKIFDKLKEYSASEGIKKIIYKTLPYIYHIIPAEEDIYGLFANNAKMIKRDFSSVIYLNEKIYFTKDRNTRRGLENGIEIIETTDYRAFWPLIENILKNKYDTEPTHTVDEIEFLAGKFPQNIRLFGAYKDNKMLAGVVVYESNANVVRLQYQAKNDEGHRLNALDCIYHYLLNTYYKDRKFFDFGSSIRPETGLLNEGLVEYKESIGSRLIAHDVYEMQC